MLLQPKSKHGYTPTVITPLHFFSPVEGFGPLHVKHGRECRDDLEMCHDDLETHQEGVLPLLDEHENPEKRIDRLCEHTIRGGRIHPPSAITVSKDVTQTTFNHRGRSIVA